MDSRLFASYDGLEAAVLSLPSEQRAKLAARLIDSLDDEPARPLDDEEFDPSSLGPEWEEEITRRLAQIASGEAVMIPHSEVMDGVAVRLAGSRSTRRNSSEKEQGSR